MKNFLRLCMDSALRKHLSDKVDWDNAILEELRKIMNTVQKTAFPDLKWTINLFHMKPLQSPKTHKDVLKRFEKAINFRGVRTKDHFLLNYD